MILEVAVAYEVHRRTWRPGIEIGFDEELAEVRKISEHD